MKEIKTVGIIGLGALGGLYTHLFTEALGKEHVLVLADKDRAARYRRDGVWYNGQPCAFTYADAAQGLHHLKHQVGLGYTDLHACEVCRGVDLLLGVEEVAGTRMQVGDADEVVVLKGIEYFLTDVAVQNLEQVVDVFVLIRHLKCVHERCELSGCTGGYTGEIQTAELALLDSGALVAKLAGEVALDGDAAVGLFLYRVSKTLAGLRSDVLCVMAVC